MRRLPIFLALALSASPALADLVLVPRSPSQACGSLAKKVGDACSFRDPADASGSRMLTGKCEELPRRPGQPADQASERVCVVNPAQPSPSSSPSSPSPSPSSPVAAPTSLVTTAPSGAASARGYEVGVSREGSKSCSCSAPGAPAGSGAQLGLAALAAFGLLAHRLAKRPRQ